jgi:mono/diheme cytochrome c family protein
VRVKATLIKTTTDADGRFSLSGILSSQSVFITAWVSGYYINGIADVLPGATDLEIVLTAHHATDNSEYVWLPSTYHAGQGENQGCAQCHASDPKGLERPLGSTLPVDEWLLDAHSQTAANPRFLTMYTGTDVDGNQSPLTRYGFNRDYGRFPLRPDLSQPYYGPGYKLDFPDTAGNCAACHLPAASINSPYGTAPNSISGVASEGIPCDFCHKVWAVRLDPSTNLPFPNMPGVLSFVFRRPPEGHQFFAGPFDDVAPGEDTYSPIQQQSQYCAPCHFGKFWDTQIYNSFGEWLESPYSDPERAKTAGLSSSKTCQDCHMPHLGATYFALPDKGAAQREPQTIFSHRMPGAADETLLQNAVTMTVTARREGGQIIVDVTILNDQTGHHIPTDSPLRQLILLVNATDGQGQALSLRDGPTVPEWGGVPKDEVGRLALSEVEGMKDDGYYAGLPGKGFAKILMELWTEITPSGAYWNPTRVVSDNRVPALGSDTSTYVFAVDGAAVQLPPITVQVTLLFRRAFIELMDQKGWDVADIVMEQQTINLP